MSTGAAPQNVGADALAKWVASAYLENGCALIHDAVMDARAAVRQVRNAVSHTVPVFTCRSQRQQDGKQGFELEAGDAGAADGG